jgi:hypothetical protein
MVSARRGEGKRRRILCFAKGLSACFCRYDFRYTRHPENIEDAPWDAYQRAAHSLSMIGDHLKRFQLTCVCPWLSFLPLLQNSLLIVWPDFVAFEGDDDDDLREKDIFAVGIDNFM